MRLHLIYSNGYYNVVMPLLLLLVPFVSSIASSSSVIVTNGTTYMISSSRRPLRSERNDNHHNHPIATTTDHAFPVTTKIRQRQQLRILLPEVTQVVPELSTITTPLGVCEGDCDGGATCAAGLKCMIRSANEPVWGCAEPVSVFRYGMDVCYDPKMDPNYIAPTTAPTKTPTTPAPTKAPIDIYPTIQPTGHRPSLSISSDNHHLDQCEGDCRQDSDCINNYVCYKRDYDGPVPGCNGYGYNGDNFCIDPVDNKSPFNSDGPFSMKIFWQLGYMWQNEPFERKWCFTCGGSTCQKGDRIFYTECGRLDTKFVFINHRGDNAQIQVAGTNLCIEVVNQDVFIRLHECRINKQAQLFNAGPDGNFIGRRFELRSNYKNDTCLGSNHHPKSNEQIQINACELSIGYDVSYFVKY